MTETSWQALQKLQATLEARKNEIRHSVWVAQTFLVDELVTSKARDGEESARLRGAQEWLDKARKLIETL